MTDPAFRNAAYYSYRTLTGNDPHTKTLDALAEQEWTPEALTQVSLLAQHALTKGTAYSRLFADGAPVTVQTLTSRLIKRVSALAARLYKHEVCLTRADSIKVSLTWAALLVALTDDKALALLDSQFATETPRWQQALGADATMSFAAGLTLDDARQQRAAGALSLEHLASLCAAKGLQWPY